jgi:hypothetical protein
VTEKRKCYVKNTALCCLAKFPLIRVGAHNLEGSGHFSLLIMLITSVFHWQPDCCFGDSRLGDRVDPVSHSIELVKFL